MKLKIQLKPGQNIFFTSDTHYSHVNICRGTTKWKDADNLTRNFQTLEEMNQCIVDNINDIVGEDDILIHLGDWSFNGFDKIEEFRKQLKCKNIYLILGNHDHFQESNKEECRKHFVGVFDHLELEVILPFEKNQKKILYRFNCFHYPICSWENMNEGVIHLHGHVHLPENMKIGQGKSLDVGVDGNNMKPYSLKEIIDLMKNQPIDKLSLPKDHHVKKV